MIEIIPDNDNLTVTDCGYTKTVCIPLEEYDRLMSNNQTLQTIKDYARAEFDSDPYFRADSMILFLLGIKKKR